MAGRGVRGRGRGGRGRGAGCLVPARAALGARRRRLLDGVDARAAVGARGLGPTAVVAGCLCFAIKYTIR